MGEGKGAAMTITCPGCGSPVPLRWVDDILQYVMGDCPSCSRSLLAGGEVEWLRDGKVVEKDGEPYHFSDCPDCGKAPVLTAFMLDAGCLVATWECCGMSASFVAPVTWEERL